jgi:hypothetical protein
MMGSSYAKCPSTTLGFWLLVRPGRRRWSWVKVESVGCTSVSESLRVPPRHSSRVSVGAAGSSSRFGPVPGPCRRHRPLRM